MKQENNSFLGWFLGINFVNTKAINHGAPNNICEIINIISMFSWLAKQHNSSTVQSHLL